MNVLTKQVNFVETLNVHLKTKNLKCLKNFDGDDIRIRRKIHYIAQLLEVFRKMDTGGGILMLRKCYPVC